MKLQNLIVIFIIIVIPIVLVFSYYLNLETKTIMLQTDYDEKLIEATKEAIEAFEINTVEWNSKYSSLANLKRQDIMSSINIFTTSMSNKLGISGTSKENILTYVPAIVYTMYDGYYIYSPTYVPETITDEKGVQLFYYENSGSDGAKITASATQNIEGTIYDGVPIYVNENGSTKTATYNGKTITFTTDINNAKKTYEHVLKTFVPYTTTYADNNGQGYIINYTLDNYIRVYGSSQDDEEYNQSKEGYVIEDFGNTNKIEIQQNKISGIKVNGIEIGPETLTENIYVRNNINEEIRLENCTYIYNSNNDKRYYDSNGFFILDDNNVKAYLPNTEVGHTLAEYKKVLICTNDTSYNWDYLELYQLLNGNDTNWYYQDKKNEYILYDADSTVKAIGRGQDCSGINYYVETCSFNHWLKQNNINADAILEGKKDAIIKNINNNLNLSISNYNANSKMDYIILELSDSDWEQALSNISMITFFQGAKIGLKTYNNYVVVSSTENNEYVSEDSLYYIEGNSENNYHRYGCSSGVTSIIQAYKNTDFKVKSYEKNGNVNYYYKHNINATQLQECFECIVNRNNYEILDNVTKTQVYDKIYYTALGRERYIQMSKVELVIEINKTLLVTFNKNGGNCSVENKEVTYNSTYGVLPEATKTGRGFAGWYTGLTGGKKIEPTTTVRAITDHTLYARWICTVVFNPNGGSVSPTSKQVIEGNTYGELPTPTRTGYNFDGWYTEPSGGDNVTATSIVPNNGDHTLYAHWTAKTFAVTFDANGGMVTPTSRIITYGQTYGEVFPTPERTGYTFTGWYTEKDGGEIIQGHDIVKNPESHTLYAHWTESKYTITFDANGGGTPNPQTKTVTYNSTYGTLATISRTGYTFAGWYTQASGGTKVEATTTVTNATNHTLYAHWTANKCTVTFNANGGGTPNPQTKTVTYNSTYGTLATVSRTGYTFAGWYTQASGGTKVEATTTVTNATNHTLYAHWTANKCTVTFNANGGGTPNPQTKTVTYNSTYGTLATVSRTGYTFAGWYTQASGGTKVEATTTVTSTSNHTIYAHWTANTYTIKFDANGGSGAPDSQTKTYGINLTLSSKVPTRANYTFLGWSTSNTATTATYAAGGTYTANEGTTLYAVWKLSTVNVTSVTLNLTADQWIPFKNNGSVGTLSLTATVAPSNATNKTVTWSSSNTAVATVSNGTVTATGAGLTTITATAGGKSASVKVYVYNIVLRWRDDWAEPDLEVNTYSNDSLSILCGWIGSVEGGTKLVIQKSNNNWRILYKTAHRVQSGTTPGDYLYNGTVRTSSIFTNYGAY